MKRDETVSPPHGPFAGTPLNWQALRFILLRFLLLFAIAVAVLGTTAWIYVRGEVRYQRAKLIADHEAALHLATLAMRQQLENFGVDIGYLSSKSLLRDWMRDPTAAHLALLQDDLFNYVRAHKDIDQLRVIDASGMERLRLNRIDGEVVAVPSDQLQNKADRYYVRDTLRLPRGGLYLSPFDLNVEHGRIEKPHKPEIRLATPVFSDGGVGRALVIVNYLGRRLLESYTEAAGTYAGNLVLINHQGYFLRGLRPQDEWGFVLGRKGADMHTQFPSAWAGMQRSDKDSLWSKRALWMWQRVEPAVEIRKSLGPLSTSAVVSSVAPTWYAAIRVPVRAFAAITHHAYAAAMGNFWRLLAAAVLICGWAAWLQFHVRQLNLALAERAEAAEAAARAKADFLANMSHEIRTPMNAVLGFAYLLEQMQLPHEAADMVRKLRHGGNALQGIINDVLDFSKIEAGRLDIERTPFSLSDLLNELSSIMSITVGDKPIELVIEPPPGDCDQLLGDGLRLEQILINLTNNAIKFTRRGCVSVGMQQVAAEGRKITLRFAVRDTGMGIAPEKLQTIFAPFIQSDSGIARRFGGTGLGLSICRQLVALMGGEIGVNSEPGKGSEFWFTLTFERIAAQHQAVPELSELDLLIADDNDVALAALREMAVALGWKATAVNSGRAAVEHVRARRAVADGIEIVVLDWQMPGLDGLAATRVIRKELGDGRDPVVIMVTAHARQDLLALPDAVLVDAVLTKPVTPSSLYNAVATALKVKRGEDRFAARVEVKRLQGVRILVVDDSEINLDVALHIFEREGAIVQTMTAAAEALAWLAQHAGDCDVVLMDVQMPELDGLEATRRIHALPGLQTMPVLALTAATDQQQRDAAIAAGMAGFIAKPFNVEVAVELIVEFAGRAARADAGKAADLLVAEGDETLPGLRVERGAEIWNDLADYRRHLQQFMAMYADSVVAIAAATGAEAESLVHSLKGTAANLGVDEVAARAADVELALHGGRDVAVALERLGAALDTAFASIRRYVAQGASPAE